MRKLLLGKILTQNYYHVTSPNSIKTVGSTKIFKSVEDHRCCQDISVNLSEESFVVMVPDPITCYEHSNFTSKQRYTVHENSSAVIVDWFTSGRLVSFYRKRVNNPQILLSRTRKRFGSLTLSKIIL